MGFSAGRLCPPHIPAWCTYNILKVSFDLASMVGALTLGIFLYFKRRGLDRRDPKRRRTLADFVDALVSLAPHPDISC